MSPAAPRAAELPGLFGGAYRAARDFGVAVVVAAWLLWEQHGAAVDARRERAELLGRLTQAVEAQTATLERLANAEREHAEAAQLLAGVRR